MYAPMHRSVSTLRVTMNVCVILATRRCCHLIKICFVKVQCRCMCMCMYMYSVVPCAYYIHVQGLEIVGVSPSCTMAHNFMCFIFETAAHTHTRTHTHTDDDECASSKTNNCSGSLVCENLPGSYRCVCPEGTTLTPSGNCEIIGEQYNWGKRSESLLVISASTCLCVCLSVCHGLAQ